MTVQAPDELSLQIMSKAGASRHWPCLIPRESGVFHVVLLIPRNDIEHHLPELLLRGRHRQCHLADGQQHLLVSIDFGLIEIEMGQRTERLQVQFLPNLLAGRSGRSCRGAAPHLSFSSRHTLIVMPAACAIR